MIRKLQRFLALLLPGLIAAGPTTLPSTRPNPVKPAGLPFSIGVNLCSAEFGEKSLPGEYGRHYVYPAAKELDYYKSKGVTLVRLPFRWERMQPVLNGELDPGELKRLEAFVAEIRTR